MKKLKIIILSIILVTIILFAVILVYFKTKDAPKIEFKDINISEIDNGTYIGEYNTDLVSAKVKVEVKDDKIIEIVIIEHENGLGK